MSGQRLPTTAPSASDWLLLNQMRMPREANDVAGKSISILTGIAAMPVLVMAHFTTNPALDYLVQLDAGHTNPSIAVGDETPAGWRDNDEAEVQSFLSFIDEQMSTRPDLLEPVDQAQLDRLSQLLANVKV